jgi:hypothetical protein
LILLQFTPLAVSAVFLQRNISHPATLFGHLAPVIGGASGREIKPEDYGNFSVADTATNSTS